MINAEADPRKIDWSATPTDAIAAFLAEIAFAAGPAIMAHYHGAAPVRAKADSSPVTDADEAAEALILQRLGALAPPIPVVAEELTAAGGLPEFDGAFLLVDPLDGTREFIAGNGEFTINIALVREREPVAGAVYAPALDRLWFGGASAFVCTAPCGERFPAPSQWRSIRTRKAPDKLVALASRSHGDAQTEAFLARLPILERRSAGSSLKFCAIAEGSADVYPRFGPTMEWDIAAGEAVLRAAGGIVVTPSGAPMLYCKKESRLRNGAFIAWGDPAYARRAGVEPAPSA